MDCYGFLYVDCRSHAFPCSCPCPFPFPLPLSMVSFMNFGNPGKSSLGSNLIAGMAEGFDWIIVDRYRLLDFST
jgi:hypothetical protein